MEQIINSVIPFFKELIMQYGLWEATFAVAFLIFIFAFTWKLASIIKAIRWW